jgi:hypothetical protein
MRKIFLLAVAAASLMVGTATTRASIAITEISKGGVETLSVDFPGAIIGGTTDDWTITLPGVFFPLADTADFPQVWAEATGDSGFNVLTLISDGSRSSGAVLGLISEDTSPPSTPDDDCGTGSPLPLGPVGCGVDVDQQANQFFVSINEVASAVPEPASWALMLVGFGLLGGAGYWAQRRSASFPAEVRG